MTDAAATKRSMPEMLRLGLILLLITAIAGVLLGVSYEFTKDIIAEKKEAVNQKAYLSVLGGDDTLMLTQLDLAGEAADNIIEVYEAAGAGYAIKVSETGYGGTMEIAMGLDTKGNILGIEIVSSSETAGLGQRASDPAFRDQYVGKNASKELTVTKQSVSSDNEIEALSGATITSRAVTRAVNAGLAYYNEFLKGGED